MSALDMSAFPTEAPAKPTRTLRYVDVGVTAAAKEFSGTYRRKKHHPMDFGSTLDRAEQACVQKVLLTGMAAKDVHINIDIALSRLSMGKGMKCYLTAGIHPYHANELATEPKRSQSLQHLSNSIKKDLERGQGLIVALGEIGLDFDRTEHASKDTQIDAFKVQLDLLVDKGWDLPVFLHCRAAFDTFVEIITPYIARLPRKGLVHSFVGSEDQMRHLLDLGLDVSVNGFAFKTTESLEMVAALPLDRMHLETDAPWGEIKSTSELSVRYCKNAPEAPASKRKDKWQLDCMVKKRNETCMISRIAFTVAGLKGVGVVEVAEAAWRNSVELFSLT